MLKIKPANSAKFRNVMDAMHKVFETKEAKGAIPDSWSLDDPQIRKESILVQTGDLYGIVYDGGYPHTRKTLKSRHEWENFNYG